MDALREYQEQAVAGLRSAIARGHKNIILCSPTGSGKTLIGSYLMNEARRKGKRALFLVDRLSLLDQTSETLDRYGIPHGVIQGGHWRYRPYEFVQVCSQQTLARREWPEADLIIVDEAHTVTETVKKRISKRDTVTIGLTATPFTKGLGKIYDELVNVTTTDWLIDQGFLSKFRIFAPSAPNMDGVKITAGEWDEKETSKRALEVVGDCVAEYLKHGAGRKFICSAVDTAHVEELHRQFVAAGVMTATYTYKVTDLERQDIVREFRKPDSYIRGLITVTAASKGFDVPDIGVVIMARPLRKSLAEHIQFFGRGLRSAEGKEECLVLDHSGNSERFWDDWTGFFSSGAMELDDGRAKAKPKQKEVDPEDAMRKCPQCKHLHMPRPFCPACGHEYPRREAVKHMPGTLTELVACGDRRKQTAALWPQIVGYAIEKRPDPERARKYALAMFKGITGHWPAGEFDPEKAETPAPDVINKIRSMNIAWAKGRGRTWA